MFLGEEVVEKKEQKAKMVPWLRFPALHGE